MINGYKYKLNCDRLFWTICYGAKNNYNSIVTEKIKYLRFIYLIYMR